MTPDIVTGFILGCLAWDCTMRITRWIDIQVFMKQCKTKADMCAELHKFEAERERILVEIGEELKKKEQK